MPTLAQQLYINGMFSIDHGNSVNQLLCHWLLVQTCLMPFWIKIFLNFDKPIVFAAKKQCILLSAEHIGPTSIIYTFIACFPKTKYFFWLLRYKFLSLLFQFKYMSQNLDKLYNELFFLCTFWGCWSTCYGGQGKPSSNYWLL